ncbi:hypothetical protein IAE36_003661 [Pseudomonas sp. S36]|nr:hypothetical protein [Pseudomonas sp. S36]
MVLGRCLVDSLWTGKKKPLQTAAVNRDVRSRSFKINVVPARLKSGGKAHQAGQWFKNKHLIRREK